MTSSDEFHDPPRFPLPAGRYHVTAVSETGQAEAEISVSAGQRQRVELRLRPKQSAEGADEGQTWVKSESDRWPLSENSAQRHLEPAEMQARQHVTRVRAQLDRPLELPVAIAVDPHYVESGSMTSIPTRPPRS